MPLLSVQFWTVRQGGTLNCDDCALILKTVTVQFFFFFFFFAIDRDISANPICVVGHQFGLLSANFHAKGRRSLV